MRNAVGVSFLFCSRTPRLTTTCGRCGDAFSGSRADGRAWLAAHTTAEHPPFIVASSLPSPAAARAQRRAARLRESVS